MGFRTGSFATVWSVEPGKGNFTKVRLSISRKNKEGTYEQDFSGYCTFIGLAHAKASRLHERARIKLGDIDVTTTYDGVNKREYVNYKVFDFEPADSAPPTAPSSPATSTSVNPMDSNDTEEEEDLPF